MDGGREVGSNSGRFPILQANRDPESNWEVDVAKSLEEYLLKICSGEVSGEDGAHSVNFAEAALLLQGSVQVYSRKVEFLYSLVLHALEFLSQKKSQALSSSRWPKSMFTWLDLLCAQRDQCQHNAKRRPSCTLEDSDLIMVLKHHVGAGVELQLAIGVSRPRRIWKFQWNITCHQGQPLSQYQWLHFLHCPFHNTNGSIASSFVSPLLLPLLILLQDQLENGSAQANQSDPSTIANEEDDIFMGLDDVPAESRTSLNNNVNRDGLRSKIVRPPANLLVFEGDCLDSEASELDTYLLATCDFYGDFLLLDPCDAPAVFDFLQGKHSGKENSVAHQGSSAPSKSRANVFTSPNARSAGTGRKSSTGKVLGGLDPTQGNPDQSSTQETIPDDNHWSDPVEPSFADDVEMPHPDDIEDPVGDYSDDEDPWKPLNPHEPGNLKIRPYRRAKGSPRAVIGTSKKKTLTFLFPMAKMDGVVIPEHAKSFEAQQSEQEEHYGSQSPPRFEKFLRSFEFGEENPNVFGDLKDDNGSNTGINFENDDPDMPNDIDVDPYVPTYPGETIAATPNGTQDDINTHTSLDDLCRSHLNALLASIAEAEKQSEMDARVSTWKERIEDALEEQDKNPPFDIGSYGEQILDTLSSRTDNTGTASFSEIVSGRPKYEVARTFSALLQLVNGRSVDLDKGQATNELVCYTAENPFHVRLIGPNRRPEMEAHFARKRVKSPLQNAGKGGESSPKKRGLTTRWEAKAKVICSPNAADQSGI